MINLAFILDILQLGLIYSLVVSGLVISFRMIGFADLTIEGSFSLGGAITAVTLSAHVHPVLAVIFSCLAGGLAGFFTAFIHSFIGISKLLSGIVMFTILYSVNLRIMDRPNYPLMDLITIYTPFQNTSLRFLLLVGIIVCVICLLFGFLSTNYGLYLRAVGENIVTVKKSGFNPNIFIITGLVISNMLIAFSGSLLAQMQGFSDIGMGGGLIVSMLASLIIGESLIRPKSLIRLLISAIVGAVVFQGIIALCLRLGIHPWDLKLATGVFCIITLIIEKAKKKNEVNKNIGADFI